MEGGSIRRIEEERERKEILERRTEGQKEGDIRRRESYKLIETDRFK